MVGTTIEPWQLFFQQSNVVDKRITPRWLNYERLDTGLGVLIEVIGAVGADGGRGLRAGPHRRRSATSPT